MILLICSSFAIAVPVVLVNETFDDFNCTGVWVNSTVNLSYEMNCSNGWKAFAEDYSINPIYGPFAEGVVQSNGSVYDSYSGVLEGGFFWLYKSVSVTPGSNLTFSGMHRVRRDAATASVARCYAYLFDGQGRPCEKYVDTVETCEAGDVKVSEALDSAGFFGTQVFGPFQNFSLEGQPGNSYVTIAIKLRDPWSNLKVYHQADDLVLTCEGCSEQQEAIPEVSSKALQIFVVLILALLIGALFLRKK